MAFLLEESVHLFQIRMIRTADADTTDDRTALWNLYLHSFPKGTNPIYIERRKYDCQACQNFIKQYGGIVGIVDGKTTSIWDIDTTGLPDEYVVVAKTLRDSIEALAITDVFIPETKKLGKNISRVLHEATNTIQEFHHFYCEVPRNLVRSGETSRASKMAHFRQTKEVIARSFNELTTSAIDTVLELIADKALYRGEEHQTILKDFKVAQRDWITAPDKDNYCWEKAVVEGRSLGIRNTAIGTLLVNLSDNMPLEEAVRKYESVVAPANYKRPKAVFSTSMRKAAETTVIKLGLLESLGRRYAELKDINIRNVLWASGESKQVMVNPFDLLAGKEQVKIGYTNHLQETGIEHFIQEILPTVESLEVYIDNTMGNNFVSLIAPENPDAPPLFKWKNGFSWDYRGNFTDSIKEKVKRRGGKVDGVLRFSLMWGEGDSADNSDLDAHCILPSGKVIYYGKKKDNATLGNLDVDIQNPNNQGNRDIVENITFPVLKRLAVGEYKFFVRNYALRGMQKGFQAEIEFGGQVLKFNYENPLRNKEDVEVAVIRFDGKQFKVTRSLPSNRSSKTIWGINSLRYHKVATVMLSPNHWDTAIGNKHFFFMLEDCVNTDTARGFYNEYLIADMEQHKKVFEALGQNMKVEHTEHQLSGVGFSSTRKDSTLIKINQGKILKINFTNEKKVHRSVKKTISI